MSFFKLVRNKTVLLSSVAIGVSLGTWKTSLGQVQTPEQVANPTTGQIPNAYAQEYYLGQLNSGQSDSGNIVGDFNGTLPSLVWYKYVSDGTTPVEFDMFGSNMGFGGGGSFGAQNYGEVALYDSQGNFIAENSGPRVPASGDSNIQPAPAPAGAAPVSPNYPTKQPLNPTQPAYYYDTTYDTWYDDNVQALPLITFGKNPQSNPLWNPSNPNYNPTAEWNQYSVLPAGTYYLAVTGYKTYFAGDAADVSGFTDYSSEFGGVTSTTPFGFISFNPMSGTYQINVRLPGDFDGDGQETTTDLQMLESQVRQFAPALGIPAAGFQNSDPTQPWVGLPSNLVPYDMTGNSRIDAYDVSAFGRATGITVPAVLTWDNAGATGNGVTWDNGVNQNFNDGLNPATFSSGAYLFFNDSNNGNYNVTITGTVSPTAVTVNNSSGNYVFSGTGGIGGTGYFVKAGSSTLTINTVNTYTDYTYVTAGTLILSSSGSLASDSLTVASGAIADINGLLTGNPDVTANGQLAIGALSGAGIHSRALSSLTIGSGGSVSLASPAAHANRTVLSTGALLITGDPTNGWTGQLDLGGNDMIVHNGDLPTITSQIKSGLNSANSGYWNGQGITSSTAANDSTHLTALGVISNAGEIYSTFDGQAVSSTDVLVKYTYYGDANLDGVVNGSDYTLIDNAYNSGAPATWLNGDFNYDGVINGDDYILIDNSFNDHLTPLTSGVVPTEMIVTTAQQISPVPEPGSIGLLALSAAGLYGRRRTTKRKTNYQLRASQPSKEECLN
jgi:autotransporter-associated beta strand protein